MVAALSMSMGDEMGNYAIVKNNVVEGVIVWDGVSEWTPPEGTIIIETESAGIGWSWDGNSFQRPPEEAEQQN